MTIPTDRALAGVLAVFAEFVREILRRRVKGGIAPARAKGTTFDRPKSAAKKTPLKSNASISKKSPQNRRLQGDWASAEPQSTAFWRAADRSDNQISNFVPNR